MSRSTLVVADEDEHDNISLEKAHDIAARLNAKLEVIRFLSHLDLQDKLVRKKIIRQAKQTLDHNVFNFFGDDQRVTTLARAAPLFAGILVLLQLLAAPAADAVEVLSAQELSSHCALLESEPEGADAQYCIRYIQGFIDGAIATDVNVMLKAEDSSVGSETFTERAMRTRGASRADQKRAAQFAGFCLGEPLPLRDVVTVVVADLQALPNAAEEENLAREAVYTSLQRHYPCSS